jgi:hypothetical protein
MAILHFPSKHWLIGLVPLSVASITLIYPGRPAEAVGNIQKSPPVHSIASAKKNPANIDDSIKNLNEELSRRLSDIRLMQRDIEITLKKIDPKKNHRSMQGFMQQRVENSDINEIHLIHSADSLLDNIQQIKNQIRSCQEILYELKMMAFRKSGRFSIDID